MASSSRWTCLLRPSIVCTPSRRLPIIATFSTTAAPHAEAKAKKATKQAGGKPLRAAKTLKLKRKAFVKTGKPPEPGERKAMRKRIVLSNTNALEVRGLRDITAEMMLDEGKTGRVFSLPGEVVDKLRAVEAFKTTQGWGLFRKPGFLLRSQSNEVARIMRRAEEDKETNATIIYGEKGVGKSLLILQALTNAFLGDWIVINVPEARDLTSASTDYAQIPDADPKLYSQNAYTANWLSQIVKSNPILNTLKLTQTHTLPVPLPQGINTTLAALAELAIHDPDIAWAVFNALWAEITAEGRPPICFTLDGLGHIMQETAYRDPEFNLIHAHDFAINKLFVDYLSGAKKFHNGGAVFAATTTSNSPAPYAVSHSLAMKEQVRQGDEPSAPDPYTKIDQRVFDSMQYAKSIEVMGLSKSEARGLMEYWAASGVLRERIDDSSVSEKWTLSGGGVIGEIERSALWMRI